MRVLRSFRHVGLAALLTDCMFTPLHATDTIPAWLNDINGVLAMSWVKS